MQAMLGTQNPGILGVGGKQKKLRVVPTIFLAKNCSVLTQVGCRIRLVCVTWASAKRSKMQVEDNS